MCRVCERWPRGGREKEPPGPALRVDEGESGGDRGGRGRKRVYEVRVGRRYNIAYANSLWT